MQIIELASKIPSEVKFLNFTAKGKKQVGFEHFGNVVL